MFSRFSTFILIIFLFGCSSQKAGDISWRDLKGSKRKDKFKNEVRKSSYPEETRPYMIKKNPSLSNSKMKKGGRIWKKKESADSPLSKGGIEVYLATIASDYKKNKTYDLLLELTKKGNIKAIRTRNNLKNKIKHYPISVLDKQIVLAKALGVTLIGLECLNFAPSTGCKIKIEYPHNLTIASFHHFYSILKKEKGRWGLYSDLKRFTRIKLVSNKIFGVLVGIDKIQLN